jgi:TonB-linked SusC/RagA family outer membrane protein
MMRLLLNLFRKQNLWRYLVVSAMWTLAVSVEARTGSSENFSIDLQSVVVTGQVTDESNQPLPGVNIIVKGTSNGTASDAEGKFSLTISSSNEILVVSFIGYTPQEIPVDNRSVINVTLSADIQTLGEVVVIGYGSQRKETVTGAVSTIKNQDLVKNDVADISNSIAGRLPGVIAVQSSAQPGDDAAQIFIRGQSTLNDNSPLVMVDGVQRDFNRIDPNQIESITVLKDAAATAVYGVRGANGVILVTTKRGLEESKPTISYSGYYGVQNPIRTPDYLNAYEYATLYNEAQRNDNPGLPDDEVTYTPDDIQKYQDHSDPYGHPDVDWNQEIVRRNAPQQRHSISLSGGSKNINYYTSFGYMDQDGSVPNVNFKTYSFRANIDADVTKSTKLSINLSGIRENRNYPGVTGQGTDQGGIFSSVSPNAFPVKWENGSWGSDVGLNPVAEVTESGYRRWANNSFQTSFILQQNLDFLTKGLSFKVLSAFDPGFFKEKIWLSPYKAYQRSGSGYTEVGAGKKPSLYEGYSENKASTFEAHLMYSRTFDKHELTGLVLYTQYAWYTGNFNASRTQYSSAAIDQLFAGPALNPTNGGSAAEGGREGYVGRITYGYDSKYLFEANFGYNGSENFPPGKRYGFFPSAAVGWVISEENFFKTVRSVDFLKIRASYGEVGNDQIGGRRFLYKQPFYYGRGYVFGGNSPVPVQSVYDAGLPNTNVTWERAKKTNIGLEAQFLKNMISFKADVFFEKRNNILATRNESVPESFGAELPVENIAEVDNKGFEMELLHRRTIGHFSYSIGGNFTYVKNKITYIDESENIPEWQRRTGRPMGQFFGYVSDGLYMTQEQLDNQPKFDWIDPRLGDIMYRDIDGDGIITPDDQTAIGFSRLPQIMYGINLGASYKGFDFSALIQGAGRSNVYFSDEAAWEFLYGSNPLETIKGRWTEDGTNINPTYPRLSLYRNEYKKEASTYWMKDASYWRLKNIQLGYTIPKSFFTKLRTNIETFRIYVSGTNLFTKAKFDQWDPEAPSGAGAYYPQQKVTSVGLVITF